MIRSSLALSDKNIFLHVRGAGISIKTRRDNNSYDLFTMATVDHYLKKQKDIDMIIFSVDGRYEEVRPSVKRSIQYLRKASQSQDFQIVLISQSPYFPYSAIDYRLCEQTWFRPFHDASKCISNDTEKNIRQKSVSLNSYYAQIQGLHPNVFVFDPIPSFCDSGICMNTDVNGDRLFSDGDHFTRIGSLVLVERFDRFLQRIATE